MGKATRLTVTKSGNGAQLTPAYLSVPLRGGWHLKTVLPNTLVLAVLEPCSPYLWLHADAKCPVLSPGEARSKQTRSTCSKQRTQPS